MGRSTVHYADNKTNNALKQLHNKLRPAGTPVQRVEYIIELLLLRIFETKLKQDDEFKPLRKLFSIDYTWKNPKTGKEETNENRLFSYLTTVSNEQILSELNDNFFPFYSTILHSAREVFEGNLPQKVKDQLVLIEEVFSNSNFTNNVNSGNLGEVINIVANDIVEARLLKTDLLGDAIESALSETGGTKDVGLFRTPDHIRQFMTAMIEPTFDDVIFDPACGTGGFLFDAFEFVMRRVDPEREWPGEKANSELTKWFDKYFKENQLEFPSFEQTTQFYRNGVTGIEYLGMIRKMAAINFYIRGLNPENIVQGDSLAKYRPVTDHESKSIILANPPFGAQRDQEAYPDVWQEYSKESETTILFVKLMFEQLKKGGQCAVVVSEGFNTWDQFSAKALRKMLLDEANLKAVISLPQGLFVSKSGVGPKTSILIFEKGGKTDWTWFYKVSNDGYTMGTNRKEQKGNQLIECLDLYHKYVKHGQKPPETKNQFCIPVDWIKTLDPRIKQKIRKEVREESIPKTALEKFKIITKWNDKTAGKGSLVNGTPDSLWDDYKKANPLEAKQFEDITENRIQNEIAKRIDKAHFYSFNLSNYKSAISDSQIIEWNDALQHIQPNGVTTLDDIYKKLETNKPENVLPYLVKLNPTNTLEADIAREYVSNIDEKIVSEHKEIATIIKILKNGAKYPMVKLKDYLILNKNKIKPNKNPDVNYKVLGVSNEIGIFLNEKLQAEETNQSYFVVAKNEFCYNPYRINVGSIGLNPHDFDNQIISGAYVVFGCKEDELNPKYLETLFKSRGFLDYVNAKASGGVRMNFKFEDMETWEIPLPSIEDQAALIAQIEKQKAIIEGINKIDFNFEFQIPESQEKKLLSVFINDSLYGLSVKLLTEGKYPVLRMNNLDTLGRWHLNNLKYTNDNLKEERFLEYGDFIFNRTNSVDLVGKSSVIDFDMKGSWAGYLIRLKLTKDLNPFYLKYLFSTKKYRDYFKRTCKQAGGQANINADELGAVLIDYFDIETQNKIVSELNNQMQILNGIGKMKTDAKNKINSILADVWGIEYTEPIIEEVLDEQEN